MKNTELNRNRYQELFDLYSMGILDPKKYEFQYDEHFAKQPRLVNQCAIIDEKQDKWIPSGFRIFVLGNGDGSYRLTLARPNALGTGGEPVIDMKSVPFALVAATAKDLWSAQTRLPFNELPTDRSKMQLDPKVIKESQWVLMRFLKGMNQIGTKVMSYEEEPKESIVISNYNDEEDPFNTNKTVQKATNLLSKFIHRKDRK